MSDSRDGALKAYCVYYYIVLAGKCEVLYVQYS